MSQRVVLREFSSRGDAEIVRELLLGSGIEAFVTSDDCGSVDPALSFGRGIQLLVGPSDAVRAEQIIVEGLASGHDGTEELPPHGDDPL